MIFRIIISILILLNFNLMALDAPAGLVPSDLNQEDTFYIIFAGSNTLNGAQTAATYVNYAATVKANDADTNSISGWITLYGHDDSSLVTTSAFPTTDRPIYNTNGDRVADNRAQLFSSTQINAIGYDEQGNVNANNIWTGFNFNGSSTGIGDDSLGGNDSLNDGCLAGNASQTDHQWTASVLVGGAGCAGVNLGLYVVSPLLTVPISSVVISNLKLKLKGKISDNIKSISVDGNTTTPSNGEYEIEFDVPESVSEIEIVFETVSQKKISKIIELGKK